MGGPLRANADLPGGPPISSSMERAVKRVERCARRRRGASRRPLFATLTAGTVVIRLDAQAELHFAHSRAARTPRSVSMTNTRGHGSIRSINRVARQCGSARWDFKPIPAVRGSSGNVFISVASALGCGHRRVCDCSRFDERYATATQGDGRMFACERRRGTKRTSHGVRTPTLARGSSTSEQAL